MRIVRFVVMKPAPVALWAVLWLAAGGALADSNSCVECHADQKHFVGNKKVYDYYQDWLRSPHREAGVVCNECHGGDPKAEEKEQAHGGTLGPSDTQSKVFFRNQIDTCGECHRPETEQFVKSKHYRRLQKDTNAPSCSTCHRVMNRKPYYTDIVEATCAVCHNEQNEEELPLVADQADEILHRLNTIKGYVNWTFLHYHSKRWPGDSKQRMDSIQAAYREIILTGHRFKLDKADELSIELLTLLKRIYKETAKQELSGG